ncbi:MAG: hypothetical protein E7360_01240 [Clostridiales bacterium]|nr:hypothetical protein [Clostridiales bacterium]
MKNSDAIRLKRVIESDRMSLTGESAELIIGDLKQVLLEYFSITEKPSLSVNVKDGQYLVTVRFKADALKTFSKIL